MRGSCETFGSADMIYIVTNASTTVRIDITALLREIILGEQRWHVFRIGLSLSLVHQLKLLPVIISFFSLIYPSEVIICATLLSITLKFFIDELSIPSKLTPLKYLLLPLCYLHPALIYIPVLCANNPLLLIITTLQLDSLISNKIPVDILFLLFFKPCPQIHTFLGFISLLSRDLI